MLAQGDCSWVSNCFEYGNANTLSIHNREQLSVNEQQHGPASPAEKLRLGCYLLRFTPVAAMRKGHSSIYEGGEENFGHFDGTFRVWHEAEQVTASGDLYYHKPFTPSEDDMDQVEIWDWPLFEPRTDGIPVFPFDKYRFHIRVASLNPDDAVIEALLMRFEMYEYLHEERRFDNRGCFSTRMSWSLAPRGYRSRADYLTGEVRDCANNVVGLLTMGWVSDSLRRAVIEIDRVADSEAPLSDGGEVNWQSIFDQTGWQIEIDESDNIVPEPSGESWSGAELHSAMLDWRKPFPDEHEWRYHLLCVRRLDRTERGFMYDRRALDSDKVPREGAAIASHWVFPDEQHWGKVRGVRFGAACAPYFRTAVHEIGHAFCLIHNSSGSGFHIMRTTGMIGHKAKTVGKEFPENIDWSFAPEDTHRLRHAPDAFIRPGGLDFGELFTMFQEIDNPNPRRANDLVVEVTTIAQTVPIGAPVRVHVALLNRGEQARLAPASLSFRDGHVSGRVYDENGNCREFRSLFLCIDERAPVKLEPGDRIEHSFTLLRGPHGALFPHAGSFRVEFEIRWEQDTTHFLTTGSCNVKVAKPRNPSHEVAARRLLETPDATLSLILAGDHLPEGRAAIQAVLDNKVLHSHYAVIEARRLATRFKDRPVDVNGAANVLDESTVMTPSEIRRLALLADDAPKEQTVARDKLLDILKSCAAKLPVGIDLVRFVNNR